MVLETATVPLSMRAAQVPAKIYPGEADDDSQARFRAPPGDEVPKGVLTEPGVNQA